MEQNEYDGIEVKADDVIYIVHLPDGRLKPFLGVEPIESLTFSDFTQTQKDEVKSWAQEEAEEAATIAATKAEEATESARLAEQSSSEALHYAELASAAEGYSQTAKEAETTSVKAAALATKCSTEAQHFRIMSQSYARGQTGERNGEDTDNARYYADQAKSYLDQLTESQTTVNG